MYKIAKLRPVAYRAQSRSTNTTTKKNLACPTLNNKSYSINARPNSQKTTYRWAGTPTNLLSYAQTSTQFARYYCSEAEKKEDKTEKKKGDKDRKPRVIDKFKAMHAGKDKADNNGIEPAPEDDSAVSASSARVKEIMALLKDCTFVEMSALVIEFSKLYGIENPGKLFENALNGQVNFAQMGMTAAAGGMPTGGAPPPGGAAAPPPGGAPAGDAKKDGKKEEAKGGANSTYKLILKSYDDKVKFPVIKTVRQVKKGMNVMDSKKLCEELPKVIQVGMSEADAKEWVEKFKAIPAVLEAAPE